VGVNNFQPPILLRAVIRNSRELPVMLLEGIPQLSKGGCSMMNKHMLQEEMILSLLCHRKVIRKMPKLRYLSVM
jgi:hypothetical protein